MITYRVEKHTNIEWVVTGQQEGDEIRQVIAKCPAEGIALTIKGMYEKEEREPDYQPKPEKPEYVPCEIKADGDDLVYYFPHSQVRQLALFAPGRPDFRGFLNVGHQSEVSLEKVAIQIAANETVVANFKRK